ncbi:helix-turn-helix domain-containing protein [Plantactinospora sp. WMMB334]|uniref:helix-turn-helix domain-containing protein n=1 Tax=Plantactinospora sp. WMMB334 TaxID=3404119 RepID=UPI003B945449
MELTQSEASMEGFDAVVNERNTFSSRTFCSWRSAGWRSVLLQRFVDEPVADELRMSPCADQALVLVTQGDAWMESKGSGRWMGARYTRGQIGLTAPGNSTELRWRSTVPLECIHLYLPGDLVRRVSTELWDVDRGMPEADVLSMTDPLVERVIHSLSDAVDGGMDDLYAESAAHFLAVHLLTRFGGRPEPVTARIGDARIRRAIEMMRENLDQQLTLEDIAGSVWMSVYHFLRVFKAATGQTPRRYLTRLRLRAALRLLRGGDLSITEVALRCGFSSPSSLSAAFSRETGMTPHAFRQNHTNRIPRDAESDLPSGSSNHAQPSAI